jgi:hypothetical protein
MQLSVQLSPSCRLLQPLVSSDTEQQMGDTQPKHSNESMQLW